jgi:hypothetical protein
VGIAPGIAGVVPDRDGLLGLLASAVTPPGVRGQLREECHASRADRLTRRDRGSHGVNAWEHVVRSRLDAQARPSRLGDVCRLGGIGIEGAHVVAALEVEQAGEEILEDRAPRGELIKRGAAPGARLGHDLTGEGVDIAPVDATGDPLPARLLGFADLLVGQEPDHAFGRDPQPLDETLGMDTIAEACEALEEVGRPIGTGSPFAPWAPTSADVGRYRRPWLSHRSAPPLVRRGPASARS